MTKFRVGQVINFMDRPPLTIVGIVGDVIFCKTESRGMFGDKIITPLSSYFIDDLILIADKYSTKLEL